MNDTQATAVARPIETLTFAYRAQAREGDAIQGTIEAPDLDEATRQLRAIGLRVLEIAAADRPAAPRGVGAALMRAAIDLAKARDQPVLCLLGHASYYPRFGFEPARSIGIEPPRPWPDAAWMALRLPAWTPELRGVARFPPAFPDE